MRRLVTPALGAVVCALVVAQAMMAELGHTHAAFTLSVYAQAMRRDEGEVERLRALWEGADWADVGRRADNAAALSSGQVAGEHEKGPR